MKKTAMVPIFLAVMTIGISVLMVRTKGKPAPQANQSVSAEDSEGIAGRSAATFDNSQGRTSESAPSGNGQQSSSQKLTDSSSTPKEGNIDRIYATIASGLSANGYSAALSSCIEGSMRKNLSREKLLTPEQIADQCGNEQDLNLESRKKVQGIVRQAIDASQDVVDVNEWYECAKKKSFPGTSPCFKQNVLTAAEDLYAENQQDGGKLSSQAFNDAWDKKITPALNKIAAECPASDLEHLTEAYIDGCK